MDKKSCKNVVKKQTESKKANNKSDSKVVKNSQDNTNHMQIINELKERKTR